MNHCTVYGDIFNNNDPSRADKRQKVDHVNDESNVWETVRQYLKASIIHDFSLEKYHIIKCGYSIKYDYTISTPFQTHSQYTTSVLAVMKKNEFKAIEKAVKSLETTEEIPSTNQNFIEEFFHVCLYIYRKPNLYERLSINKTSFNHSFIWLIMEFVVNSMPDMSLKFSPAEYILSADACISVDENELSILETSGKILLNDNSKYGSDHIKVHYGALSIFNAIYKKYYWASEATALKLHIPFLHARDDMIHFKVPRDMTEINDIPALGDLSWCFKPVKGSGYSLLLPEGNVEEQSSVVKIN
ncbi:hypothetical protein BCV71DRAFT_283957 [Rhizopus microsporus]|uniref:Uncharacterized protein n=1 Tax=Rhizopus microsporus TaxID=58291 RepID=A0A1X0S4T2_RHIZD|nr:hypothetical protein BCV71DRAFT_283957 [Rhizopus microsporus]